MNDIELRLECFRVASENCRAAAASAHPARAEELLSVGSVEKYAENFFRYIMNGFKPKVAA